MHFAKSLKNAFLSIPAVFRARFARSLAHRCVPTSSIVPPLEESVRRRVAAVEAKLALQVLEAQKSALTALVRCLKPLLDSIKQDLSVSPHC